MREYIQNRERLTDLNISGLYHLKKDKIKGGLKFQEE